MGWDGIIERKKSVMRTYLRYSNIDDCVNSSRNMRSSNKIIQRIVLELCTLHFLFRRIRRNQRLNDQPVDIYQCLWREQFALSI